MAGLVMPYFPQYTWTLFACACVFAGGTMLQQFASDNVPDPSPPSPPPITPEETEILTLLLALSDPDPEEDSS